MRTSSSELNPKAMQINESITSEDGLLRITLVARDAIRIEELSPLPEAARYLIQNDSKSWTLSYVPGDVKRLPGGLSRIGPDAYDSQLHIKRLN
jgi:hypothetical protein